MARLNVDIRANVSPMDFQWQQGHGPAASDSPFMKGATGQQQRHGFAGHKRESCRLCAVQDSSHMLTVVIRFI